MKKWFISLVIIETLCLSTQCQAGDPARNNDSQLPGGINGDTHVHYQEGSPNDGHFPKPDWLAKEAFKMLDLVNQARQNPAVALANCEACLEKACYDKAMAALTWEPDLARAALFHARHLVETNCFAHRSSCELKESLPPSCEGQPSCACKNDKIQCATGTDTFERVERFTLSAQHMGGAENLAGSSMALSAEKSMELLLLEKAENASCDPQKNRGNGHRINILTPAFQTMGAAIYCDPQVQGQLKCVAVQLFGKP